MPARLSHSYFPYETTLLLLFFFFLTDLFPEDVARRSIKVDMMEDGDEKASCDRQRKEGRHQLGRRPTLPLAGKAWAFVDELCENAP